VILFFFSLTSALMHDLLTFYFKMLGRGHPYISLISLDHTNLEFCLLAVLSPWIKKTCLGKWAIRVKQETTSQLLALYMWNSLNRLNQREGPEYSRVNKWLNFKQMHRHEQMMAFLRKTEVSLFPLLSSFLTQNGIFMNTNCLYT